MATAKQRLYRLGSIISLIKHATSEGKVLEKNQFISEMSLLWGTSRRTGIEYLRDLELAKKIKIVDDEIFDYEKYLDIKALQDLDTEDIKEELQGGDEHEQSGRRTIDEYSTTSTNSTE